MDSYSPLTLCVCASSVASVMTVFSGQTRFQELQSQSFPPDVTLLNFYFHLMFLLLHSFSGVSLRILVTVPLWSALTQIYLARLPLPEDIKVCVF